MSFILDALKKSEVERQRQAIPGLMDSRPLPPRAKFPLWAAALIALLVVNLVILAVVLTRGGARADRTEPDAADRNRKGAACSRIAGGAERTHNRIAGSPATAAMTAAATRAPAPTGTASASAAPDHFSPMDAAPPVYAPEIPPAQDYPAAARRSGHAGASSEGATHRAASARPIRC